MKSFFKKLSLVLAAAMVITMLPLQSAKAASKITLGPDKETAAASQTAELKVGDQVTWKFWGVDNYNTAGSKTKVWTSSNTAVATVANGTITAVAAGKTKITLTLTNNGIEYSGSVDLTVVAKDAAPVAGAPTLKQVSWQSVELTFADADAAKAAVDAKISVTRVKTDKNGKELDLFSGAKIEQKSTDKKVVVISQLSNEVEYKVVVPGYKNTYKFTMSVGEPVAVKLTYPTVYISANDKVSNDISGNPIKYPEVTPVAEVVDANGVVCESVSTGFKFSTDKTRNTGNPNFSNGNGRIRFNKADSSCYVKCEYTYKNADGKTVVCDYDEATVVPVPYTTPNFQGFVEKITLTETSGKEIEYPSDYSYRASIAIGQDCDLAFYFETPDGTKYAPSIVFGTVQGSGLKKDDSYKEIKADGNAYSYYVVKDDKTKNKVSINTTESAVKITGFEEGTQTICVYERRLNTDGDDPQKDKLVGVLTITVEPKAEIVDFHLSDNSVNGFHNTQIGADKIAYITFELEDQYGNNTLADIKIRDENGSLPDGVFFVEKAGKTLADRKDATTPGVWRNTKKGAIAFDLTVLDKQEKGKTFVVSVDDQKDPCRDNIYVTSKDINVTAKLSYALMVSDKTVKNSTVANNTDATKTATALSLAIEVVRTRGGDRYDPYAEFYLIGDDDINKVKGNAALDGKLLVWITKEDGTVLKKTVNGEDISLASHLIGGSTVAYNNAFKVASGASSITGGAAVTVNPTVIDTNFTYSLDLIKNVVDSATNVNLMTDDTFLKGRYTIYLYQGNANAKPTYIDNAEVFIDDQMTKISQINTTYRLTTKPTDETTKGMPVVLEENNEKVKSWTGSNTAFFTTESDRLVMQIVRSLYTWVDVNSDGVAAKDRADQGEIKTVKQLFGDNDWEYCTEHADGSGFVPYSLKYVMGAEGSKEVYISSVTIRFRIGGGNGALVEQTLELNSKFTYDNALQ